MAQSLANILIHIIFSTKKRLLMILPEIMQDLYSYMVGIARAHHAIVHEIGGIEDHVHLLISLPRTISLSKLIEEIKKGSSKWIKTKESRYTPSTSKVQFGLRQSLGVKWSSKGSYSQYEPFDDRFNPEALAQPKLHF